MHAIETRTAGQVMVPIEKYPHIPYWFTIRQAMAELVHCDVEVGDRRSLPRYVLVFDEKYRLMGTIRRRDLLRGLEPEFLLKKSVEERKTLFDFKNGTVDRHALIEKVIEETRKNAQKPVSEIMRPIEQTVDYDDHIFKIIYDMNIHGVSMLPVMRDGHVVGVVRTVDVFKETCTFVL